MQNKKQSMSMSVMHYKVTTQCVQSGFPLASSNQNPLSIVTECLTGLLFISISNGPSKVDAARPNRHSYASKQAAASKRTNQPVSRQRVQRVPAPKPAASNVNTPSLWRRPGGNALSRVTHVQSTYSIDSRMMLAGPNNTASLQNNSSRHNDANWTTWVEWPGN